MNGKNKLHWRAGVEVIGGYGKNNGFGGSGGIVYFDGTFRLGLRTTFVYGGLGGNDYKDSEVEGCANGASGTAYWVVYDVLMANNKDHPSNKVTNVGVTLNRNKEEYPKHYMVANDLLIGHKAILNVKGYDIQDLATPIVDMIGDATIKFDFDHTIALVLKYKLHFYVGSRTFLDFSKISMYTHLQPYTAGEWTVFGNVNLGHVAFSRAFKVSDHTNTINVLANITDVFHSDNRDGYVELYSQNVRIFYRAKINVQNVFLFANETIHMHEGSEI